MAGVIQHGINLSWTLGNTSVTITGVTGIYQDMEANLKADKNEVRDQRGNVATVTYYNPLTEATFTWVPSDANSATGSAQISYPGVGTTVTTTADGPFSGSWQVDDLRFTRTNTENAKAILKATQYTANTIA